MRHSANSVGSRSRRIALLVGLGLVLGACAGGGSKPDYSLLEHQLMAEIAMQRGQHGVAAEQYLSLAEDSEDPAHARRATELAYEYGFDIYALAAAERWVELAPEDRLAHAYLGQMYVRSNEPDKAVTSLDYALGVPDERADRDYIALSSELLDAVPPQRVVTVFEIFAELYPETPGIYGALAVAAAQADDYERAADEARRAIQLAPDMVLVRVWLARFLLAAGETTSAFEQMAFVLELNSDLGMELEFIELIALAGEEQDARERLARLEERYPDNPEFIRARAALLVGWDDLEAAEADYSWLLADAWYVNESFWYLGEIARRRQNYLQAIRYYERVGSGAWLEPARTAMSGCYIALGDPDTALVVQREYVVEYPKAMFDSLQLQVQIMGSADRVPEALEQLDVIIGYKPWDERLWLVKGGTLEYDGQTDAALAAFREAVEIAPDSADALNALGYTLANAGEDYAEAQELIGQALEMQPDNPAFMDSMGWVLYRTGQPDEALIWLEEAYGKLEDAEIAAHLGEVLWELGRQDEAVEVWTVAMTRDPDNPVLNKTTERYLQ